MSPGSTQWLDRRGPAPMSELRWLKRCVRVARDLQERAVFAQAYRQYRREGCNVVAASTKALFVANALAQRWTEPR